MKYLTDLYNWIFESLFRVWVLIFIWIAIVLVVVSWIAGLND